MITIVINFLDLGYAFTCQRKKYFFEAARMNIDVITPKLLFITAPRETQVRA